MSAERDTVQFVGNDVLMPRLVTVQEAADVLRCSVMTVYRMAQGGRLESVRLTESGGGSIRIYARSVAALLGDVAGRESREYDPGEAGSSPVVSTCPNCKEEL